MVRDRPRFLSIWKPGSRIWRKAKTTATSASELATGHRDEADWSDSL